MIQFPERIKDMDEHELARAKENGEQFSIALDA